MTTALILVPLTVAWLTVTGWTLAPLQHHGTRCTRTVNGVNRGTQPRVSRPGPFHTAPMPVLPFEPVPDSGHYPAEEFTDGPVVPGFMRPEYGQACVLRVDEAQRLAGAYLP